MNKKNYTREEKIKYYQYLILHHERKMLAAQARLDFIKSEKYQDWNSSLESELKRKKVNSK